MPRSSERKCLDTFKAVREPFPMPSDFEDDSQPKWNQLERQPDGTIHFAGSPNQLIALILQDILNSVYQKRLEELH